MKQQSITHKKGSTEATQAKLIYASSGFWELSLVIVCTLPHQCNYFIV